MSYSRTTWSATTRPDWTFIFPAMNGLSVSKGSRSDWISVSTKATVPSILTRWLVDLSVTLPTMGSSRVSSVSQVSPTATSVSGNCTVAHRSDMRSRGSPPEVMASRPPTG